MQKEKEHAKKREAKEVSIAPYTRRIFLHFGKTVELGPFPYPAHFLVLECFANIFSIWGI